MLRIYSYSLVLLESSGVLQRSTLFPTSRDGRNILYDDEYSKGLFNFEEKLFLSPLSHDDPPGFAGLW